MRGKKGDLVKKTLKRVLWWIILTGILKLVVGGLNTFFIEWVNAAANYKQHYIIVDRCDGDAENAQIFSESCSKARYEITKYPFSVAITRLIEQTPSCLGIDCMDVFVLIFNSWII